MIEIAWAAEAQKNRLQAIGEVVMAECAGQELPKWRAMMKRKARRRQRDLVAKKGTYISLWWYAVR